MIRAANWIRCLGMLFLLALLLSSAAVHGQDGLPTAAEQFNTMGASLKGLTSWNGIPLTEVQKQTFEQMQRTAKQIMADPGFAPVFIQLFNQYQDQDGYARQALYGAVISGRKYETEDIPFLKDLYVMSLDFEQAKYPTRLRTWVTPSKFRYQVADRILSTSKQGNIFDDPDVGLVPSDPKGWFEKHFPGEAEAIRAQVKSASALVVPPPSSPVASSSVPVSSPEPEVKSPTDAGSVVNTPPPQKATPAPVVAAPAREQAQGEAGHSSWLWIGLGGVAIFGLAVWLKPKGTGAP